MSNEKIWCGSGKEKFDGDLIDVSICLSDIPKEHIQTGKNGKKYINLNVGKKREVDQWGKTHGVSVNTWRPDSNQQPAAQKFDGGNSEMNDDDLPF